MEEKQARTRAWVTVFTCLVSLLELAFSERVRFAKEGFRSAGLVVPHFSVLANLLHEKVEHREGTPQQD